MILTLIRVRFLLALFNDCQARPRHLAVHLARRYRGGPDLRRKGVDGTPRAASLTRIRQPVVFLLS